MVEQEYQSEVKQQVRRRIQATPLQFAAIAESLRFPHLRPNTNINFEEFRSHEKVIGELSVERIKVDDNHDMIFYEYYHAKLEAILLPSNDTLLIVRSSDNEWVHIKPMWLTLMEELAQMEFLDEATTGEGNPEIPGNEVPHIAQERSKSKLPNGPISRHKWKTVWWEIQQWVSAHITDPNVIAGKLVKLRDDNKLPVEFWIPSPNTIREIIRAGLEGELDVMPPNSEPHRKSYRKRKNS